MKARAQALWNFVKSDCIAKNYPAETLSQAGELLDTMRFVEQMFPDRALIMCQRAKDPRVQYVTPNCTKLFGMETSEIYSMSLPQFLSLAHPDDFSELQQCFAIINDLEPYDPTEYRFTLQYRIRHKQGHFVTIADEKFTLKSSGGKFIYLNSFRDISADEKFHNVKMYVHKNIRGEFKLAQTYIPRMTKTDFTPRQKDVANLVSKGFSNIEIARRLSVSINTVKNHKTLLFRKVNVRSSVELSAQFR